MFKRVRHLRISLAAKCQLLFGAAVIMIIAATLFVPWRRMDELTNQLNDRAAYTLARTAKLQHIVAEQKRMQARDGNDNPPTRPADISAATEPSTAVTAATTATTAPVASTGESFAPTVATGTTPAPTVPTGTTLAPPPAVGVTLPPTTEPLGIVVSTTQPWNELLDDQPPRLAATRLDNPHLTKYERRAVRHFLDTPTSNVFSQVYVNARAQSRYFYAARLKAETSCLACHVAETRGPAAEAGNDAGYIGFISVDILSLVDDNQVRLNRLFIFLAGLLAGSLAIAVFYLITTRIILQPVRVLQETAEKVSQGDLNIRSDISTGDEFQQLAETFNTMLANMKQSTDQLQSMNKNLDLKLGQLAESNVALYESNRLKSEFLANVSHELRTPLNSILGFADLLREALAAAGAGGSDSKPARYVQNIQTSGRNLLDLINDLLDLAKIEAGRMEIRGEPLSLSDLFEGLIGVLKPLSESKQLNIAASVAPDVPIIQTDPAKLQQVLYNLLSNAIKFSPAGGRVDLAATLESETTIRITVTDQGPGIEPQMQEIIFEKFRQIDAGHTRQHGGTGLGLSIARELTMLLGGAIGVRSIVGEGASFSVVLPLKIQPETKDVRAKLLLS